MEMMNGNKELVITKRKKYAKWHPLYLQNIMFSHQCNYKEHAESKNRLLLTNTVQIRLATRRLTHYAADSWGAETTVHDSSHKIN